MHGRTDWGYFEAHITIEPVFDKRFLDFSEFCLDHSFQASEFLMKKRSEDTPERSKFDLFCTSRDKDLTVLKSRLVGLLETLRAHDFKIWRYKIEDTIIDSRHNAEFFPI